MNHQPLNLAVKTVRKLTQFAYQYTALAPLAEFIRKNHSPSLTELTIDDFDGNLYFNCDLTTYITSEIFWRGYYSYHQLFFLNKVLKPDMVFIDVGANEGEFTCFAAKRLTSGLVISFEPVDFLFEKLSKNIQLNQFKNVKLIQKGLSNNLGYTPIYATNTKRQYNCQNHGLPTIYPRENCNIKLGEIELTTLDDWLENNPDIQRLDIIKMDIEGSELKALQGAVKTILKFRPLILLEVSQGLMKTAGYTAKDIIDYLKNLGYHYQLIYRHDLCTQGGQIVPITEDELTELDDLLFYPV